MALLGLKSVIDFIYEYLGLEPSTVAFLLSSGTDEDILETLPVIVIKCIFKFQTDVALLIDTFPDWLVICIWQLVVFLECDGYLALKDQCELLAMNIGCNLFGLF